MSNDLPGEPRIHINALLIMSSAVMVEGAVSSLLLFYLNGPFSPFKSAITVQDPLSLFEERNRELLIKQVGSATWKDYKQLFSTVTGLSLPDIGGTNWPTIVRLFDFRNLLFHGEQLKIKGAWQPDEGLGLSELQRSKNDLFEYLENNNLIAKPRFGKTIGWSFLNDAIADHFVDSSRQFLRQLSSSVPDGDNEETLPKRIKLILSFTEQPDASISSLYS